MFSPAYIRISSFSIGNMLKKLIGMLIFEKYKIMLICVDVVVG